MDAEIRRLRAEILTAEPGRCDPRGVAVLRGDTVLACSICGTGPIPHTLKVKRIDGGRMIPVCHGCCGGADLADSTGDRAGGVV